MHWSTIVVGSVVVGSADVGSVVVDSADVGSVVVDSADVGSTVVDSTDVDSTDVDSVVVGSPDEDTFSHFPPFSLYPGPHCVQITSLFLFFRHFDPSKQNSSQLLQ